MDEAFLRGGPRPSSTPRPLGDLSALIVQRERGCPNPLGGCGCACLGTCHELEDVIRVADLLDWLARGGLGKLAAAGRRETRDLPHTNGA